MTLHHRTEKCYLIMNKIQSAMLKLSKHYIPKSYQQIICFITDTPKTLSEISKHTGCTIESTRVQVKLLCELKCIHIAEYNQISVYHFIPKYLIGNKTDAKEINTALRIRKNKESRKKQIVLSHPPKLGLFGL